ncbi:HlyD family type I secretion periplasmic adaptor subunit [Zooshikella ganghwensis]|uniref:Membrane fusion protein (MFP) family protein n=1 Tax=Zooshikella ganghwensis TaxID=202772 RepID=A0A4P9VG50_9GAMM|nr:HlyD family type I secretion periplasmic adaptor subunit [Zooshikella ganghwensis]RDH42023.1 HlyD family type I secretion periplasmic adaptor subunit [Zooshikella ganghwensis]
MSIKQHLKVALSAWRQQRKEPKPEKRKAHEYDFLPAYLEVTERPPTPYGRAFLLGICALVIIALAWSIIGRIDIIASATGKLIVSSRTKVIQPIETAEVIGIHVQDGQFVKKGDVLIELNPTGAAADVKRLTEQLQFAKVDIARWQALRQENPVDSFKPEINAPEHYVQQARHLLQSQVDEREAALETIDSELSQSAAQLSSTQAEIISQSKVLSTKEKRLAAQRKLVERDAFPRLQMLELEEETLSLRSELGVLRNKVKELEAAAVTIKDRRKQTIRQWSREDRQELNEAQKRVAEYTQERIKAIEKNRLQTLKAPVDGVVQQLEIHTIGGVVSPAQQLLVIVPENALLEAEALVLNKDIGFVVAGQPVEIKIDSFPYTKYGTIAGTIKHVSRDAVEHEQLGLVFPARIEMEKDVINVDGEEIKLGAGMSITAEIKTGDRRVIEYLLSPLQEYQSEALRER